jgi:hypothetical protein
VEVFLPKQLHCMTCLKRDRDGPPPAAPGTRGALPAAYYGPKRVAEIAVSNLTPEFTPGTVAHPVTFFHESVLELYDALRKKCPGTSADGLARVLAYIYRRTRDPSLVGELSEIGATLAHAHQEWEHLQNAMELLLCIVARDCPACGAHDGRRPVAVAIDGCFSLNNYASAKGCDAGLHASSLYVSPELEAAHARCWNLKGNAASSKTAAAAAAAEAEAATCSSDFTAARRGPAGGGGGSASQRLAGVLGAIDRHGIIRVLVDIRLGEAYAYTSAVEHHGVDTRGLMPRISFYDIMCRWAPWMAQRLKAAKERGDAAAAGVDLDAPICSCGNAATGGVLPAAVAKAEGVARAVDTLHSYAHSPECQRQWAGFLNFADVAGWTTGIEAEQVWQTLRLLANSTKHMGLGRRADALQQYVGAHNVGKQSMQGKFMLQRMRASCVRVVEREGALTAAVAAASAALGITPAEVEAAVVARAEELLGAPAAQDAGDAPAVAVAAERLPRGATLKKLRELVDLTATRSLHASVQSMSAVLGSVLPMDVTLGALPEQVRGRSPLPPPSSLLPPVRR